VGARAGLGTEDRGKILCLCRGPNPDRPVRSQTPYRLSYPVPVYVLKRNKEMPSEKWKKINGLDKFRYDIPAYTSRKTKA
jgi:hypothetical protein